MDQTKKKVSPPVKAHLKAERVQESLQRLPGWSLGEDGGEIVRKRKFNDSSGARAYVNNVCRLAAMRRQPVEIGFSGAQVVVTLKGHPVRGCTGGLTETVLNLAATIG